MTTELEKQFFDTFGIEPKTICSLHPKNRDEFCRKYIRCPECIKKTDKCPQITDRQFLELICLYTKEIRSFTCYTSNLKMLKEEVLKEFISEKDGFIKHQVQAIFEGER